MATLPRHIGFIVDGNRRWATERGLKLYQGHEAGRDVLRDVLLETLGRGVSYVSAYVFSTENWKRSPLEVRKLMNLLLKVLEEDLPLFHKHRVRIRVLGQIAAPLPKKVIEAIKIAEKATEQYNNKHLLLCLNYGGQQEIADAVQKIMLAETPPETVTPELIEQFLYAPDVPPCDLVVRTSGEQRLSNFMLWRSAYSELMFIDKPWPDMTKADVTDILATYEQRNRRFGG